MMRLGAPIGRNAARERNRRGGSAVHLPDCSCTTVITPDHIILLVVVDVTRPDDVPIGGDAVEERSGCNSTTCVHQPDRIGAIVVVPEQVGRAVAIEVTGADYMPVGRHAR